MKLPTMFMKRSQLMELLQIKSRETIRTRLRTDPKFPKPVGGRRLWRTRDVMRYVESMQLRCTEHDVEDLV